MRVAGLQYSQRVPDDEGLAFAPNRKAAEMQSV